MRPVEPDDLIRVVRRLDVLGVKFVFLGGSVIGFLLDNPRLSYARPTNDVDAIMEVATRIEYTDLEERLRKEAGFHHDLSAGAPACRWIMDDIKVDIMPMRDPTGQFANEWFEYALQTAERREFQGVSFFMVTAACLLATKILAFRGRGANDYHSSHDLEDIVTLVDGRAALCDELAGERPDLRAFVAAGMGELLGTPAFLDALPGHLLPDAASQARLPLVIGRLRNMASFRGATPTVAVCPGDPTPQAQSCSGKGRS